MVAVLQLGAQRQQFVVDARGRAVVADVGVDAVGEVDGRGAARQRHDLALRREHVDLVREEVALDVLEEFLRVAGFRLDLEQALQPARRFALRLGEIEFAARLVQPVRGDARFGDAVHVVRADLHFQRRAERAEQRRVQRLVAVGLGDGDVVLELAGDGLVQLVQHAERRVAVGLVGHQHAHAVDVEHLRERVALLAHLLVDGVDRLLAAADDREHVLLGEALADDVEQPVHHLAPVAARRLDRAREDAVAHRVQVLERQVLQFEVERVQTEAVGDRRVDVERFVRDALAVRRRHRVQRAHVVQAVGELDQDDAHVARHREQHLAEALRLDFFAGRELDLVELRHAVDHVGHRLAERRLELGLGDGGVLHHVVQQRGGKSLRVEPPLREDAGDRERMRDVRFARLAELSAVCGFRELERARHERDVRLGQVVPQMLGEFRDLGHTCYVGPVSLGVNPAGWSAAWARSWSAFRCRSCRPPFRAAR